MDFARHLYTQLFSEVDRSRLKSMSERLTPRIGDMRVEDENGEVHIMSTQV